MKNKSAYVLLALAGLLLSGLGASAQSRGETSLYNKTFKKPSLKAAEKFLKKYPESVYAPRVVRLRDSLVFYALDPEDAAAVLSFRENYPDSPFREQADERILRHNTSVLSKEEARQLSGECLDAIGWRKDNVEHILALDEGFRMRVLSQDGQEIPRHELPVYTMASEPGPCRLVLPLESIKPQGGRSYIHYAYRNGDTEYVEALYLPEEDLLSQAIFYGKALPEGRIEGQSPEMMEGVLSSAEISWITGQMRSNPALVPISKADLLTDESIRWWLQKNPKAATTAKKVSFGSLDPESSLVAAYKKAPKEKGKSSSVALFDIRGYTVICSASRTTGNYNLLWCEPTAQNKKKDAYIRTIYFEKDGTTLDLVYYKGHTTFKIKISLTGHTLYRTR